MIRSALMSALVLLPGAVTGAAAQRRANVEKTGADTNITIAVEVGGKSYRAIGAGECRHATDASIDGVPAALWMVQFGSAQGRIKQLNLTVWRPKNGTPDQLSFAIATTSGSYRIQTGARGANAGRGTVKIGPNGSGGKIELTGNETGGKPITATIECPVFSGVEAEGG